MRRIPLIAAALALVLLGPGIARAQFTVTDIVADAQTTETAIQSTAAVAKQIQQYEMQVQQYQNMLQNTAAPLTNLYRQTTSDISGAQSALDGVTRLVPTGQSVNQYLSRFTSGGVNASTDFCATATQMIQKNLSIAPMLKIRPGYRFNVVVTKDLVFQSPYRAFDYRGGR